MTVEALLKAIEDHDPFFDFGDDQEAKKKVKEEEDTIIDGIRELRILDPHLKTKVRAVHMRCSERLWALIVEGWFARGI
jgi:hypothetical protein